MNREIRVSLPVPLLWISETGVSNDLAVDLFFFSEWQRTKGLRQQLHSIYANRYFSGAGAKERPVHADDVAEIEMSELCVALIAQMVLLEVELDLSR
jgi:hypothetical protein